MLLSQRKAVRRKAATKRGKDRSAWAIPALAVGVVALLVAGVLLTAEQRLTQDSSAQAGVPTSQALATRQIPYPAVARTSLQEAIAKIDAGEAVLVDVRSRAAYEASHAAGSISFPEEEIEARLDELPEDRAWILV